LTASGSRGRAVTGESMASPPSRSLKLRVSKTSTKRSRTEPTSDVVRQPHLSSHAPTVSVREPPVAVGRCTSATRSCPPFIANSWISRTSRVLHARSDRLLHDSTVAGRIDGERMSLHERGYDGPARGSRPRPQISFCFDGNHRSVDRQMLGSHHCPRISSSRDMLRETSGSKASSARCPVSRAAGRSQASPPSVLRHASTHRSTHHTS
jgi:hypothetical protein